MKRIGIAGFGTIGRAVARHIENSDLPLALAAVSAGDRARAQAAMAQLARPVPIVDTSELVALSDVIVDSAPTAAFRDIAELGYTEGQVKSFAKSYDNIPSINPDTGEPATRTGLPSDHFPAPYANETAARAANNNALPPDLSLITKAREDGKNYVYSLITGFQNPPANLPKELQPATGLHYNPYFANLNLAMAPPLADGQVTFADGSPNDLKSMAKDVTAFLVWTAEPKLVKRVWTGWAVFLYLLIFTILAYLSYRNIWAGKEH